MNYAHLLLALAALMPLATPAAAKGDPLEQMMSGQSAMQGKKLERAIKKADKQPLGSLENPVRVAMPQGQRAYLASLRCSDGQAPGFVRQGNMGLGVFGNFVDHYRVSCASGTPAELSVYMDMYHHAHVETRSVPGFTRAE